MIRRAVTGDSVAATGALACLPGMISIYRKYRKDDL